MADWVSLARVRRARGIRGEVVVESFGSLPERFQPGLKLFVSDAQGDREAEVERA